MTSPIPAGSGFTDVAVADVYRAYSVFSALAASTGKPDLAHQLVLCEPLSVAGEAPMIAASIASAASLCIEPSTLAVRHSTRSGAIDFTVNNLDEALRALKNEVRKGLSIAICLAGDPSQLREQMVERGVQPDLICNSSGVPAAEITHKVFVERGARVMDPSFFETTMVGATWRVKALPGQWLPRIDELAAAMLPEDDRNRRQWLKRAPRYLGRALRTERYLPMTAEELENLVGALRRTVDAESWDVAIAVEHDGLKSTIER